MKRKFLIVMAILAMALMAAPAGANTFTFSTPAGAIVGGVVVDATAVLTTGAGTIDIQLTNNIANIHDVGQALSDFAFSLTAGTTASFGTSATDGGTLISVGTGGAITSSSTVTTSSGIGWVLSQTGPSTYLLDDLAGGAAGPQNLILGPPTAGVYSNANGSIASNPAHNPFFETTVEWLLNIAGVTADTTVMGVTFSFGTTPGNNINVPIPPSALLLGTGLLGLVGFGWRRKRG